MRTHTHPHKIFQKHVLILCTRIHLYIFKQITTNCSCACVRTCTYAYIHTHARINFIRKYIYICFAFPSGPEQ